HRWLSSVRSAKPSRTVSCGKPRRRPLRLEALEDRVVPSQTPQMVLDINPTPLASPSGLVAIGSTTYFSADDGIHGRELWKTAGTALVSDINPGSASSSLRSLTNVNGTLFFSANDGVHGQELWKSDGTAAGTTLVGGGSNPSYLTNVNGTLFFAANDSRDGWEL